MSSPTATFVPGSDFLTLSVIGILVFHTLNGIRLVMAELAGIGIDNADWTIRTTLILTAIVVVVMGVFL